MNSVTPDPARDEAPRIPAVPSALLDPWLVIAVGTALLAVATIAAFAVPALDSWRPICVAGLGVGVLGTTIFLWQRRAARRGARGAQTGLDFDRPPSTH